MTGFETRAVHVGQAPDPVTGAIIPPIHLTTTFVQPEAAQPIAGYDYARAGTPTRTSLEQVVSSLEGVGFGYAYASGLAAADAVLRLIGQNDHVLLPTDVYGGLLRLIDKVHEPRGLQYGAVDFYDTDVLKAAWRPNTRMVWLESPTNPTLGIIDIAAVTAFAHERGALVVVDNTFATPYLQRPAELGADIVLHSLTKYMSGHSDVTGGFAGTNDAALSDRLYFLQKAVGAVLSPLDCYLVTRGVKTLALRMERHCDNAEAVAQFLVGHPAVQSVFYPGLSTHPHHDMATRQMRRFGGMVSFIVNGGEATALEVVKATRVFALAESLGAVESLIEHPGRMTHAPNAGTPLEVDPGLIRLSVGIETIEDLIADLDEALR